MKITYLHIYFSQLSFFLIFEVSFYEEKWFLYALQKSMKICEGYHSYGSFVWENN